MSKLDVIFKDNKIDKDELLNALYLDIREIILKAVINKMKTEKDYFLNAKRYYFTYDNNNAAKKIIKSVCDLTIGNDDLQWFDACFKAFFNKKDKRAPISPDTKLKIITDQNSKCAICGADISIETMHVDHIIPWDYVGDELHGNLQGLCRECNLHKSNHVAQAVSSLILK